jgi:hypothetical protein
LRWLALSVLLAVLFPMAASAQDDTPSLGDLARNLRKGKSQQQTQPQPDAAPTVAPAVPPTVIDNDNLAQAIEDAKKARPVKQDKTVFSIDPASNTVKVSSPDVTCSLSFNARASSLLIKPVLIEDLPLPELLKIDGPGSIQDENLQLEIFNGTDWDLREITVGLTLERKPGENAEVAARARIIPAAQGLEPATIERRSDVTLLYQLKATARPFSTTSFHENIGITPGPDEDWRWSIVEAKGIRPSEAPPAPDSQSESLFESKPESKSDPLFAAPSSLLPGADHPQPTPAAPAVPDKTAPDKASLDKSPSLTPEQR